LLAPINRFDLLMEAGRYCLELLARHLAHPGLLQQGLFEPAGDRARAVARFKHQVNARLGRSTLRRGVTLPPLPIEGLQGSMLKTAPGWPPGRGPRTASG
jgi:hypothetical protein